jgi:hypothetical protein
MFDLSVVYQGGLVVSLVQYDAYELVTYRISSCSLKRLRRFLRFNVGGVKPARATKFKNSSGARYESIAFRRGKGTEVEDCGGVPLSALPLQHHFFMLRGSSDGLT